MSPPMRPPPTSMDQNFLNFKYFFFEILIKTDVGQSRRVGTPSLNLDLYANAESHKQLTSVSVQIFIVLSVLELK